MPGTLRKGTTMNYNEERMESLEKETEMIKKMKLVDKNVKTPMVNILKDL